MKQYTLFLLLLLFSRPGDLWAQSVDSKLISVDFHDAPVRNFAETIESKIDCRFYYDPKVMDSLRVTLKADQKSLDFILEEALKNTGYHYAISAAHEIFLTRTREIRTELAAGYFKDTGNGTQQQALSATTGYTDSDDKKVADATTENKLYEIGVRTNTPKTGNVTLAGYLRDVKTGEPLVGVSLRLPDAKTGTASDQFGFYSMSLPPGKQTLLIKGFGIKDTRRQVILYSDGKLNIDLQEQVLALREVKLTAEKIANIRSVETGVNRLTIQNIKQVPVVFGEADVLRVVLTLPGVQSVGEATTGFNVRGGSADQNLILLNDATIYNPAHFFGFFSAFNPDIVKDVELYKSTIPERFGGRISSVLDVTNREGNKKKYTGTAGLGMITSRFNIEGPIDSTKTSFIVGGRTTYSNWLLKLLPQDSKNSSAAFSDLTLGISHQANEKNNIYLSLYYSTDKFKLNSDTAYGYSNKNGSIKWKHTFSNKMYGVLTGGFDHYDYNSGSTVNPINAFHLGFAINQANAKADFTYYLDRKNTLTFGLSSIRYSIKPGSFIPAGPESLIRPDVLPAEHALESALYFGDKVNFGSDLSLTAGIRYSIYNFLGPQTLRNYAAGLPKTSLNVLDSTSYGRNKFIKTYHGPEIRVSARYNVTADWSVKAAYNTLNQYIHLLSNTTAIAPTDVWKLSDPNIRPQHGSQVSFGLYRNLKSNTIETSVEVYYKRLKDYLDYKSGALLVMNHHIETDVINTNGKAYGAEFLIRKNTGSLNGWMSYTWSRTFLKMDDPAVGTPVNGGDYYPANYDKPHDFNFTGNYRFSHRYSLSLNMTYSTGRPITLPIAKYSYAGGERVYYSDRNAYRIPDYFRTDVSVILEGNHKLHQFLHNSWIFGVYNLTGQQNAYSVYFTTEQGQIKGYKLSIFAKALPFVNYNIRF